jgi:hypothetical protein
MRCTRHGASRPEELRSQAEKVMGRIEELVGVGG